MDNNPAEKKSDDGEHTSLSTKTWERLCLAAMKSHTHIFHHFPGGRKPHDRKTQGFGDDGMNLHAGFRGWILGKQPRGALARSAHLGQSVHSNIEVASVLGYHWFILRWTITYSVLHYYIHNGVCSYHITPFHTLPFTQNFQTYLLFIYHWTTNTSI